MRTLKSIILLFALSGSLFTSCKKESKEEAAPTPAAPTPGTFSAKVNGTSTTFTSSSYYTYGGSGSMGVAIQGSNATSGINFVFIETGSSVATGTKTIDGLFTTANYQTGGASQAATSGTLVITSCDGTKISGTFSFSGNGVTVTNGTFTNVLKL